MVKDNTIRTTIEELKILAREKGILYYSSMNKIQLLISTWKYLKKEELLILAKGYYRVEKTSTMNKKKLVLSILNSFTIDVIRKNAKIMKIARYSTMKTKQELVELIIDYDFTKHQED